MKKKKLTLNHETIRKLLPRELREAAGGDTDGCPTGTIDQQGVSAAGWTCGIAC